MAERSLNVPNAITVLRLILSLFVFWMMQHDGPWFAIAGLFVFTVVTDILDGWIARKFKLVTTLGRILDPFADKFITGGVFVFLLPHGAKGGVSPWIVIAVLAREMLVTSLRGFLERQGKDFSASFWGKLKMFLQCAAATACLLCMDPSLADQKAAILTRDLLVWAMAAVTIYSGWIYIRKAMQLLAVTG